jgi:cytosine/adenosine deaminase-related metal-dependent hydrolase
MPTTVIRNAHTVIAWDGAQHVTLSDVDVAWDGNTLTHIGPAYAGNADTSVDGSRLMVMPGLVNVHSHPSSEPMLKGLTDEVGTPGLYNSSLYEYLPIFRPPPEAIADCARVAFSELLLSGVTTLVDLSMPYDAWLDVAGESGLRVVMGPMFRSARWFTQNGHRVDYEWDAPAGERAMEDAFRLLDRAKQHPSGRISGMVVPAQIDTCTEGLLRDSHAEAVRRGLTWQTHAAQSVSEFHEITRRHGFTPIGWLHHIGVLTDRSIIGHAIFLDDHASTPWHTTQDLALLAETGAAVAHCPTVFARRGITLRDIGRYCRAGVKLAIGTDTFPHNMLDELRLAMYLARTQAGNPRTLNAGQLFTLATAGAADILQRPDIGRLAVGCHADLVLVDVTHPAMRPARDPVRSLLYAAGDRAIQAVYVDGAKVVEDGRVLTMDYAAAAEALEEAQARMIKGVRQRDWARRGADEVSPPSFPAG